MKESVAEQGIKDSNSQEMNKSQSLHWIIHKPLWNISQGHLHGIIPLLITFSLYLSRAVTRHNGPATSTLSLMHITILIQGWFWLVISKFSIRHCTDFVMVSYFDNNLTFELTRPGESLKFIMLFTFPLFSDLLWEILYTTRFDKYLH